MAVTGNPPTPRSRMRPSQPNKTSPILTVVVTLCLGAAALGASPSVPRGKMVERQCKGTRYFLYVPQSLPNKQSVRAKLLVLVHGRSLNPREYAGRWVDAAEAKRVVFVAPLFDVETFPNYNRLNIMGVRADLRLLEILDDVAAVCPVDTKKFYMYGHSAGGQFAHRFALVHPERIARGVASAAGNYTFPDPNVRYHYGIGPCPGTEKIALDVGKFVGLSFAVVVGGKDNTPDPSAGGTDAQGLSRLERGRNFFLAMKTYAKAHELPCRLSFHVIPGVGHSSSGTTPFAKQYLLRYRSQGRR